MPIYSSAPISLPNIKACVGGVRQGKCTKYQIYHIYLNTSNKQCRLPSKLLGQINVCTVYHSASNCLTLFLLIKQVVKDIKIRYVLVISLITDKSLGTKKPSTLSINHRHVGAQIGNLVLAYISVPKVTCESGHSNSPTKYITLQKASLPPPIGIS